MRESCDGNWQIVELDTTDSTNTQLARRVLERFERNEPADRIAVIARRQSAGRGQHGRTWESPDGGLYLSASAENIPPAVRDRLALAIGLAIAHALEDIGIKNVGVRWPNDVMLAGKKIGGVLCEGVALANRFAAIIGMGLNVNTLPVTLPETATSLIAVDGRPRDLTGVARSILAHLARTLETLRRTGLRTIIEDLHKRDVLCGQPVVIVADQEEIHGTATGVSIQGELMVSVRGATRLVNRGTVMQVGGVRVRGDAS